MQRDGNHGGSVPALCFPKVGEFLFCCVPCGVSVCVFYVVKSDVSVARERPGAGYVHLWPARGGTAPHTVICGWTGPVLEFYVAPHTQYLHFSGRLLGINHKMEFVVRFWLCFWLLVCWTLLWLVLLFYIVVPLILVVVFKYNLLGASGLQRSLGLGCVVLASHLA
jgi:hypothetical protein